MVIYNTLDKDWFECSTFVKISDMFDSLDYLMPVSLHELFGDTVFNDGQLGQKIILHTEEQFPDLELVDLVIIGLEENRGSGPTYSTSDAANAVRRQLYPLHGWHEDVMVADLGNVRSGAELNDSYAALQMVLSDLLNLNKQVLIIGGSHDLTLGQYQAYRSRNQIIEATCIDANIDLRGDLSLRSENFLLDMLTSEPNVIRHYNHIGFQSYFVHPRLLETLDKLHFDCYRLGQVKERISEMEPVLRSSHLISFDISSIQHAAAPANHYSPNGLTGEEACTLTQYAGMSNQLSSIGIYGYDPDKDHHDLTALLIAQMIWYVIDGILRRKMDVDLNDRSQFIEFHACFSDINSLFLQSKRSGRWWMQLPDKQFIPCSITDYQQAARNEMPERWLRAQERAS
jgi:arginase family enzyme